MFLQIHLFYFIQPSRNILLSICVQACNYSVDFVFHKSPEMKSSGVRSGENTPVELSAVEVCVRVFFGHPVNFDFAEKTKTCKVEAVFVP